MKSQINLHNHGEQRRDLTQSNEKAPTPTSRNTKSNVTIQKRHQKTPKTQEAHIYAFLKYFELPCQNEMVDWQADEKKQTVSLQAYVWNITYL